MNRFTPHKIPIPWPQPETLARLVQEYTPSLWLDSADTGHPQAKHSYLCLTPRATWTWEISGKMTWQEQEAFAQESSWEDLNKWYEAWSRHALDQAEKDDIFLGGLMGFLAYEAWSQDLPWKYQKYEEDLPLAQFFVVDTWLHLNHESQEASVYSWGMREGLKEYDEKLAISRVEEFISLLNSMDRNSSVRAVREPPLQTFISLQPLNDRETYLQQFQQIQEALKAGDCYQINLAQKFVAPPVQNPAAFYLKLRQVSPAPQMAFVNLGEIKICSASPEILLQAHGSILSSYPIKGTRPRLQDLEEDQEQQKQLLESTKDAAELLMIVDLVRHDLGRVAQLGSVRVPRLKGLQSFSHVHHLVAQVKAILGNGKTIFDALQVLFPGGSITGAPKYKAMEWIHRLESFPRGIYTGSLGYLGFGSQACFNIAIRTALLKPRTLEYFAGGGIVLDSNPEAEYQEIWDKAQGLLVALQAETRKS